MAWTVWTDGSGTTGGPAGIGFVATCDEPDDFTGTFTGSLSLRDATNQQAELLAAAYALHELAELCNGEPQNVTLVSDSEYLVKGWNEYVPAWRANGWRKRTGGTPKNLAHWHRLGRAVARHASVRFEWTRGHAGTDGNEQADKLAGAARRVAQQQQSFGADTWAAVAHAADVIRGEA